MALLTRRGWSLLGAAVGLTIAGRLLGTPELTGLGLCGLALLAVSERWSRRQRFAASLVRTIRPAHTRVGAAARVDLELIAGGAVPQATLTDGFDGGRRAARFVSPPLQRGDRARAAYRIPTERRGKFGVGGTEIGIGDPFGLTRRTITLSTHDEIVVVPRVHDLRRAPVAPGQRRTRSHQRLVVPVPTASYDEFLTLREYQTGDDLRRVHWRSTARVGDLMVRDDETDWQPRTVLLLDNRPAPGPAYETAIEALASIAVHLNRSARGCEVMTTAGRHLGARPGAALRAERLLEELAIVEPDPEPSIAPAVTGLRPPARRGVLVAVTAATDAGAVAPFVALAGPGAPVVIVACGATLPPVAHRLVTVIPGDGDRLATAWAAVAPDRRRARRGSR